MRSGKEGIRSDKKIRFPRSFITRTFWFKKRFLELLFLTPAGEQTIIPHGIILAQFRPTIGSIVVLFGCCPGYVAAFAACPGRS